MKNKCEKNWSLAIKYWCFLKQWDSKLYILIYSSENSWGAFAKTVKLCIEILCSLYITLILLLAHLMGFIWLLIGVFDPDTSLHRPDVKAREPVYHQPGVQWHLWTVALASRLIRDFYPDCQREWKPLMRNSVSCRSQWHRKEQNFIN